MCEEVALLCASAQLKKLAMQVMVESPGNSNSAKHVWWLQEDALTARQHDRQPSAPHAAQQQPGPPHPVLQARGWGPRPPLPLPQTWGGCIRSHAPQIWFHSQPHVGSMLLPPVIALFAMGFVRHSEESARVLASSYHRCSSLQLLNRLFPGWTLNVISRDNNVHQYTCLWIQQPLGRACSCMMSAQPTTCICTHSTQSAENPDMLTLCQGFALSLCACVRVRAGCQKAGVVRQG